MAALELGAGQVVEVDWRGRVDGQALVEGALARGGYVDGACWSDSGRDASLPCAAAGGESGFEGERRVSWSSSVGEEGGGEGS